MTVNRDGKFGYINLAGDTIIAEQYDGAHNFSSGYAAVCAGGKWGWISTDGTVVVAPQYDDVAADPTHSLLRVKRNDKWGAVSTNGETVIPFGLDSAEDAKEFIETRYIGAGARKMTRREVTIFNKQKLNFKRRFAVSETIPNEYWDY